MQCSTATLYFFWGKKSAMSAIFSYPPIPPQPSSSVPTLPSIIKDTTTRKNYDNIDNKNYFIRKVQYLHYEVYSPVLFVLDFDNTLAVADSKQLLQLDFTDNSWIMYIRPFLYEFLSYLRSVNKFNILVLWTAGKEQYINQVLILCNIAHYFHHILSYVDCRKSFEKYGAKKAYKYLIEKYPHYSHMRSIIIDNEAVYNALGTRGGENNEYERKTFKTYFKLYSVLPYTIRSVVQMHGAFNIPSTFIRDIDDFIQTKGLIGIRCFEEKEGGGDQEEQLDPYHPKYGDTVLLTLMHILEKEVFNCGSGNDKNKVEPELLQSIESKISTSYVISNRETDVNTPLFPFTWMNIEEY